MFKASMVSSLSSIVSQLSISIQFQKKKAMELEEVCRLCLQDNQTKDFLKNIFDKSDSDEIVHIVATTTGIQMTKKDDISKSLCEICITVTKSMYFFRLKALENTNKLLVELASKRQQSSDQQICEDKENCVRIVSNDCKRQLRQKQKHVLHERFENKIECIDLTTDLKENIKLAVGDGDAPSEHIHQSKIVFSSPQLTVTRTRVPQPQACIVLVTPEPQPQAAAIVPNIPNYDILKAVGLVAITDLPPRKKSSSDPLLSYINKSKSIEVCSICRHVCNNKTQLAKHKRQHYRCRLCTKNFVSERPWKEHNCTERELKQNKCEFCNKKLTKTKTKNKSCCEKRTAKESILTVELDKIDHVSEAYWENMDLKNLKGCLSAKSNKAREQREKKTVKIGGHPVLKAPSPILIHDISDDFIPNDVIVCL